MQWIGIDVSKDALDVFARGSKVVARFDNEEAGHLLLCQWAQKQGPCRLVMEPTGGYEQAALCVLLTAGLDVSVVNPRQVRDFA